MRISLRKFFKSLTRGLADEMFDLMFHMAIMLLIGLVIVGALKVLRLVWPLVD